MLFKNAGLSSTLLDFAVTMELDPGEFITQKIQILASPNSSNRDIAVPSKIWKRIFLTCRCITLIQLHPTLRNTQLIPQ